MSAVRLLPYQVAAGPWNMAADEALLESAAQGVASLRFYGWTEPTLSLGYFQQHALARAYPGLGELAWLRRPSGGLALVHHRELTYTLALPPGSFWQPSGESWLLRMHQIIREVLSQQGLGSRLCETPVRRGEVLCFLHHTPGDLVLGESKVVGSAQRKQMGALLQHGSILLHQSPHTPELPGIADLSGRDLAAEELTSALTGALARWIGCRLMAGKWSSEEGRRIGELLESRYQTAQWNERR